MAELCEKCGKRPATCVYTRRIGEREQKMLLCSTCASAMGVGIGMGTMGDFLFGDFGDFPFGFTKPMGAKQAKIKKCDLCGATMEEILQSGKVGCPRCYATFAEELAPRLSKLHDGAIYKADPLPRGEQAKEAAPGKEKEGSSEGPEEKAAALQKELEAAVAAEDYEKAAVLRDEIKALKKEGSANGMV